MLEREKTELPSLVSCGEKESSTQSLKWETAEHERSTQSWCQNAENVEGSEKPDVTSAESDTARREAEQDGTDEPETTSSMDGSVIVHTGHPTEKTGGVLGVHGGQYVQRRQVS